MELMEGGNLTKVLDKYRVKRDRMDEREIAYITREVLKGLKFMHDMKRLHRDIKSANVLLSKDGQKKLGDFGSCVQLSEERDKRTAEVGTPHWMAPEVISGFEYDYKADLWSVGILAIECAEWNAPIFDIPPRKAMDIIRSSEKSLTLNDPHGFLFSELPSVRPVSASEGC